LGSADLDAEDAALHEGAEEDAAALHAVEARNYVQKNLQILGAAEDAAEDAAALHAVEARNYVLQIRGAEAVGAAVGEAAGAAAGAEG
jgi:hypothetical protein